MGDRASRSYKQKGPLSSLGPFVLPLAALIAVGILFVGVKMFFASPKEPEAVLITPAVTAAPTVAVQPTAAPQPTIQPTPKAQPKPTAAPTVTPAPRPTKAPAKPAAAVTPPPARQPSWSGNNFAVQIGAFATKEAADALAEAAKKQGYRPSVHQADVGGKIYFRVRVAGADTKGDAQALADELTAKGYPIQIVPNK